MLLNVENVILRQFAEIEIAMYSAIDRGDVKKANKLGKQLNNLAVNTISKEIAKVNLQMKRKKDNE